MSFQGIHSIFIKTYKRLQRKHWPLKITPPSSRERLSCLKLQPGLGRDKTDSKWGETLISLGNPCPEEESAALYVPCWVTVAGPEGGGSGSERAGTGAQVETSLCLWVSPSTEESSWCFSSAGERTRQDTSKPWHRSHLRTHGASDV